jgi:hypothetical protein
VDSKIDLNLGPESARLDALLSHHIDEKSREALWGTVGRVFNECANSIENELSLTGVVLGYVQSGKTTAITSLIAKAADSGVQIIISLLGTTNLLLEQNSQRISQSLGIGTRNDYRWVELINPSSKFDGAEMANWLSKGRCIFIPILKHAGRINSLRKILAGKDFLQASILIIDDEADQSSLNTAVNSGGESRTYEAIRNLRECIPKHCYVQFTATPYAILMLGNEDSLFPNFIEFLEPGTGYTGGREFFVNNYETVIKTIPLGDEQGSRAPIELSRSLKSALATFFVGATFLLAKEKNNAPVSMLVHPSAKTSIQERYRYLLTRYISDLSETLIDIEHVDNLPLEFQNELERLGQKDVLPISEDQLIVILKNLLKECKIWVLNSTTSISRVDWNISPVHILVGGNKLDRGFTVEGLTVTYMNRSHSDQVDTTEQRARAFGYRSQYIPYCKFFASSRTISMLKDIVLTEYDLRSELQDAVLRGESISEWSQQVGLLLPEGSKPTRDSVVKSLTTDQLGWHHIRRPVLDNEVIQRNSKILSDLGLFIADFESYGRLSFRSQFIDKHQLCDEVLSKWEQTSYSPNWYQSNLIESVQRVLPSMNFVKVVLIEQVDENLIGSPRSREWRDESGFINIFQGRDNDAANNPLAYLGDRTFAERAFDTGILTLQIHRIHPKETSIDEVFVPAIYLGNKKIVRKKHGA